jgi:glyoxylase-like metal-dependent hydrolase (beta-lactamase superfamily II)
MADLPDREPSIIDLDWMGRPRRIGAWRAGDVLVDCGPHTSLERLLEGLGDWRPRALLLTHIHFDHAGAAGALVDRWPDLEVWVHRRGARHLVSPERLEASARRVFGEAFDERFGPLQPIPEANVHALDGGEVVHGFQVLATPGHASHHVSFLDESGVAFVGDVAAVRLDEGEPILLPTPPPDIDLDEWSASVDAVAEWQPTALALAHFGRVDDPEPHLERVRETIARHGDLVRGGAALEEYVEAIRGDLVADHGAELLHDYETVVPLDQNYVGLARWAEQRAAR